MEGSAPTPANTSQPATTETAPANPAPVLTIGDVQYDLAVSQKIPYLASFVNFQTRAQPQTTQFTNGPISFFDVALKGIESGYRHCFRAIPADLAQHHVLCETYDFLGVDILNGQSIDAIFADVKAGKTNYEVEYKNYYVVKGNKAKARDAAFRLLYLLLLGEFEDENKDCVKVYNAVLFVVSHSGMFKWRARMVVRLVYEERFVVSAKQRARLDGWFEGKRGVEEGEEDVTTEDYEDDEYDSDWDC